MDSRSGSPSSGKQRRIRDIVRPWRRHRDHAKTPDPSPGPPTEDKGINQGRTGATSPISELTPISLTSLSTQGSSASPSTDPVAVESPDRFEPGQDIDQKATFRDLWDEAYENLRRENPRLIRKYEEILLSQKSADGYGNGNDRGV